jgi:hypothetical protein
MIKPLASAAELHASFLGLKRFERTGMVVLLILLVLGVFVVPVVLPSGAASRFAMDVLLTLILLSGIVAVAEYRWTAIVLAVLSFIAMVLRWSEWFVSETLLPGLLPISAAAALLILALAVGTTVFVSRRAVAARILGAVVLYLLIGLIWGFAYFAIETFQPGALAAPADGEKGIVRWIYFSFVTLTTVGYGDITPVARAARSLAIFEGLLGQLYPAIILGKLLSLPTSERSSSDGSP